MTHPRESDPRTGGAEPPERPSRPFLLRALRACWIVFIMARPRYLGMTLAPFLVGELWSPGHDNRYLALGAFQVLMLRVVSSVGNCVSDQAEDAVDHPTRVGYCNEVGYSTLRRAVQVATLLFIASLTYMVFAVRITGVALGLWILALALKLSYSFGPRLKPRRYSATLLLGALSVGNFAVGWVGRTLQWNGEITAVLLLMWALGSSLCGSKDAPNLQGDANIGYRSPFTRVLSGEQPVAVTALIVGLPILLSIVAAVVMGKIGFAAPVVLAPVAAVFLRLMTSADDPISLELVREIGYAYWIMFLGALLIGVAPSSTGVVWIMLVSAVWYVTGSWWAHPDPTALTREGLLRGLQVVVRGPSGRRSRST